MRNAHRLLGLSAFLFAATAQGAFANTVQIKFPLAVSTGAAACLPNAAAQATVTRAGQVEHLHLVASGLPRNIQFDLFVIQVPTAPFGMAWYQGDLNTDSTGRAVGDYFGRFSIETFMVAPGTAAAPVVFNGPFPDASSNPPTNPIQMYHLGLWFNSPVAAQKAGCANTVTPFNGPHTAGIQAMNTANFPVAQGPLFNLR